MEIINTATSVGVKLDLADALQVLSTVLNTYVFTILMVHKP